MQVYKSSKLNLKFFTRDNGNIRFEDGVEYTQKEVSILSLTVGANHRDIHNAKKHFNGRVIE